MRKVTPMLWYDGQAEEAAKFYVSVFKDGKHWEKLLSGGGEESMCGWLKDKYRLSWQVTPDAVLELMRGPKAAKVMEAFMKMRKFDIAALERAAA